MDKQYIIAITWLSGFILSFWMLKAEHEAETKEYTNGDKATAVLLSLLSFAMVLFVLVKAWAASVPGYWNKSVRPAKEKRIKTKAE